MRGAEARGYCTMAAIVLCAAASLGPGALGAQSLSKRLDPAWTRRPSTARFWGVAVVDQKGAWSTAATPIGCSPRPATPSWWSAPSGPRSCQPDLTVRTSLYAAGPIKDGVLQGDLVLYGRGDPTLRRALLRDRHPA